MRSEATSWQRNTSDGNHTRSYFRTRHASSVTTSIIIIPRPNPFRDSLRSSQECPVSTYSEVDTTSTYACLKCSDYIVGSTTNNAKGITSKEDCKCLQGSGKIVHDNECKCPAGKFFDSSTSTCQSCVDGSYKSEPGNEPCTECGLKKITDGKIGEVR